MLLDEIIDHIRNRSYMSGVERDRARIKATGEVFTPTDRVIHTILKLEDEDPTLFSDPNKNFLDNSCGDGQILGEVLIRKVENGIDFETALGSIYGVEMQLDNCILCRERLLCGREDLRHIVEQNIVCANALRYHYRFDGSHPYDDEVKAQEEEDRFNKLFSFE